MPGLGNGIPAHLRDAHYPGSKQLGHGQGYKYAHDAPHAVATQQYPPDDLVGRDYYEPTANGAERDIATRLERLRKIIRGTVTGRQSPVTCGWSAAAVCSIRR